jgi:hypothetical protein
MQPTARTKDNASPTHLIPLLEALKPAGLRFGHEVLVDVDTDEALLLLTFQPRFTNERACEVWATLPLRGAVSANVIADVAHCLIESVDVARALERLLDHAAEVGLESPAVVWHKCLARHLSDHLIALVEDAEEEIHALRSRAVAAGVQRTKAVDEYLTQLAPTQAMHVPHITHDRLSSSIAR